METKRIKPHDLDDNKERFDFFTIRKGKAQYHILHLPDNSCGLYYALRVTPKGLEGRRAVEPTDEIIVHFKK